MAEQFIEVKQIAGDGKILPKVINVKLIESFRTWHSKEDGGQGLDMATALYLSPRGEKVIIKESLESFSARLGAIK